MKKIEIRKVRFNIPGVQNKTKYQATTSIEELIPIVESEDTNKHHLEVQRPVDHKRVKQIILAMENGEYVSPEIHIVIRFKNKAKNKRAKNIKVHTDGTKYWIELPETREECERLGIELIIIDGQHRFLAFSEIIERYGASIDLNITIQLNLTNVQMSKEFRNLNKGKPVDVDTNNYMDYQNKTGPMEDISRRLAYQVSERLNKNGGYFHHRIKVGTNRKSTNGSLYSEQTIAKGITSGIMTVANTMGYTEDELNNDAIADKFAERYAELFNEYFEACRMLKMDDGKKIKAFELRYVSGTFSRFANLMIMKRNQNESHVQMFYKLLTLFNQDVKDGKYNICTVSKKFDESDKDKKSDEFKNGYKRYGMLDLHFIKGGESINTLIRKEERLFPTYEKAYLALLNR